VITVPVVAALAAADALAVAGELAGAAADGLPDVAPAAAVPAVDPPPLLQAATISAAASGTPSLTGTGIRARNELRIFIVSLSDGADLCQAVPKRLLTDVITGAPPRRLARTHVSYITAPRGITWRDARRSRVSADRDR
jgi:hypothetical protein